MTPKLYWSGNRIAGRAFYSLAVRISNDEPNRVVRQGCLSTTCWKSFHKTWQKKQLLSITGSSLIKLFKNIESTLRCNTHPDTDINITSPLKIQSSPTSLQFNLQETHNLMSFQKTITTAEIDEMKFAIVEFNDWNNWYSSGIVRCN